MDQNGSEWIRMDQIVSLECRIEKFDDYGSEWISMDQNGSDS